MFNFKIIIIKLILICFASKFVSSKAVRDVTKKTDCLYKLDERKGKYNPIITDTKNEIIPPTSRTLHFRDGDAFVLQCPSTEKNQNTIETTNVEFWETKCKDGKFYVGDRKLDINGVSCTERIQPRITKRFDEDDNPCAVQGADGRTKNLKGHIHKVDIGFQLRRTYINMIEVCIDEDAYGTLWTKHILHGRTIPNKDKVKRPNFKVDNTGHQRYFNFSNSKGMNDMYSKIRQVETIQNILGTNTLKPGTTIFDTSPRSVNFIQKGHLSPDGDFVFDYQQDITYFFVNIAPQFGAFNSFNWEYLEVAVRKLAASLGRDLVVVTGTFGILTYPDAHGHHQQLYLKPAGQPVRGHTKNAIPIPKFFWKVVFDEETNKAAAFIGMNDVYSKEVEHPLCPTKCAIMKSWIKFDVENVSKGHVTCCDLESFSRAIRNAPDYRNRAGKWPSLLAN